MAIGDDLIIFLYDDKGTPYGMFTVLDGVQQYFFYLYNAQGDVIAIIDDYAERVVNYEYSTWGELLSVTGSKADTVGTLNPFRYRGYCYDTETGLYYLNSRYYDPVTQRFVNGDGYASTGQGILGYNMFAYCLNNPVNKVDLNGSDPGDLFDTMDEAAIDFAKYINQTSIDQNVEFASYIYTKSVTVNETTKYYNPNLLGKSSLSWLWKIIFGNRSSISVTKKVKVTKYTYRYPKRGNRDTSRAPRNIFWLHNKVAQLHTHAGYNYDLKGERFSVDDYQLSIKENIPSYLVTPSGKLWKFIPPNGEPILIYDDLPHDPHYANSGR